MGLHEIQTAVHVAKDKRNEFGKYNYRTAEGILAALKAALPDGATVIVSDTMQEVAGKIFVTSTATIRLSDGAEYSAQGHAMHPLEKKGMDPSQITGAASSYARKYALGGLLALDDGSVDPDAKDNREPEFDPAAARDRIKKKVTGCKSIPELQAAWKSETDALNAVKSAAPPMYGELVKAKDDMKAHLDPAMQAPADDNHVYQ